MTNGIDDPRFSPTRSGSFRERYGPLGRDAAHSNKKLCLVATDAAFLIDLLYGLSQRADCFYVKYGTLVRDGMLLARCFLATDEATSSLCQELKGHPKLMVSLQDDAWFAKFRSERVPAGACGVWDDAPEHEADIETVIEAAFGRSDEARLVAALRAEGAAIISLTAQVPPAQRDREAWPIVGHVLLSPVDIDNPEERRGRTSKSSDERALDLRGLGLGPLAVAPAHQRKGFGACLVNAALRRARALGYGYAVVLGDPDYYARFGFLPAAEFGLAGTHPDMAPYFMALELVPGALAGRSGVVHYHPAFSEG